MPSWRPAQARNAELVERTVKVLAETTATLERSRKKLERVGQQSPWSYVWEALRIIAAVLPFLMLGMK